MNDKSQDAALPRYTKLEAFNPHRAEFMCKHEADVTPAISEEAEALFQNALTLDNPDIWPAQRDYQKIAKLYEQAANLGHWKAQFNLAGLYLKGIGVPQDIEKAISLTEDLMRKGVPAAWDNMGSYYMGGVGSLEQDATVAYAFWQRAADLGSMAAQTYIGAKLLATSDQPPEAWANRRVGMKMLECAYAQGYARAGYELGLEYATVGQTDKSQKERAIQYFHQAVKLGSMEAANSLFSDFASGSSASASVITDVDLSRSERYAVFSDALRRNRDLRFPNLDKVLPLPPAKLPMWDGNKETLINAAKAVVPKPAAPAKPAAQEVPVRTGRAYIPEGWGLPDKPQTSVTAQYESTAAPVAGYWIARLMHPVTERQHAWNAAQLPLAYKEGELFDRTRPGLRDEDGRIQFHYLGQPVERAAPVALTEHPLVSRGVGRHADLPALPRDCKGHFPCPQAGIWRASVAQNHPSAALFNQWHRQAYVARGGHFPDPKAQHLAVNSHEVTWQWLGQANELRGDLEYVSLGGSDTPAVQS
ncbi:sel1 repeat family protein [Pseudoduganella armeniaca]|uniref:Sel1 repeat family protein n=2 Tax=Pseudoduganella armeniaca TaxID=2072590 RepID=A0A2R4CEF8_9BURK|nr:sel1 repeat family protein [Pseudoduganella armeniaca]